MRLSETPPISRRAVAPIAEWVARAFWLTIRKPDAPLPTRLTQNNKRAAKGSLVQSPQRPLPSQQNVCLTCGKAIERSHRWCAECSQKNAIASLLEGARVGRLIAHGSQGQARLKETKRRHDLARSQWSPSSLPAWLTEEVYEKQIRPRLTDASLSQIAAAIDVSIPLRVGHPQGQTPTSSTTLESVGGAHQRCVKVLVWSTTLTFSWKGHLV